MLWTAPLYEQFQAMNILLFCIAILLAVAALFHPSLRCFSRLQAKERLFYLAARDENEIEDLSETFDWHEGSQLLKQMNDRFGRAGYVTGGERRRVCSIGIWFIAGLGLFGGTVGFLHATLSATVIGVIIGCYLGLTTYLYFLRFQQQDFEREILFQMPIFLESVVILVEAGLGILPALEKVVTAKETAGRNNALTRLFHLVYRLSAHGMPFGNALELVAESSTHRIIRHVLLHLDISGSEGGELIPSLRALSDHAHTEWRLAVEQRVKRLENLVVFPVFASVLGLMCVTAAVPMVPLLDLKDALENNHQIVAVAADESTPKVLNERQLRGEP